MTSPHELAWRVPDPAADSALRLRAMKWLWAGLLACALLAWITPGFARPWAWGALLVLAPVGWWAARHGARRRGPNIRLDAAGLHWRDARGPWFSLSVGQVRGYRVGFDPLTEELVPSLTLLLENDWESQPVELRPPVTPALLREWLQTHWRLVETPAAHETFWEETLCDSIGPRGDWFEDEAGRWLAEGVAPPREVAGGEWMLLRRSTGEEARYDPEKGVWRYRESDGGDAAPRVVEFDVFARLLDHVETRRASRGDAPRAALTAAWRWWLGETPEEAIAPNAADSEHAAGPPNLSAAFAPPVALDGATQNALRDELVAELCHAVEPEVLLAEARATRDAEGGLRVTGRFADRRGAWRFRAQFAPDAASSSSALLASLEFLEAWPEAWWRRLRQGQAEDARKAGVRSEFLGPRFRWVFRGSRTGLRGFVQKTRAAAERIAPTPPGARPRVVNLGGWHMPIRLCHADAPRVEDFSLHGPPAALRALADDLERQLAGAAAGDEMHHDWSSPRTGETFRLVFLVESDDFDPANIP